MVDEKLSEAATEFNEPTIPAQSAIGNRDCLHEFFADETK
jgi:hypothetical protein